ncbi:MAG: ABC transporter [Myxococcales bacterium]|nr:ABC transporter [Myxococcales bacterium]
MNILNARQLSKSYGPRVLFTDASLVVDDGEKIGVIGVNGSGKSTLFKILAGEVEPDDGVIAVRRGASVGYLSQSPRFPEGATPRSVVAGVMKPVSDAIARWNDITGELADAPVERHEALLEEQAELQRQIERGGGWAWEHHVENVIERLGIQEQIDAPVESLSGGQHRRVALARLLLSNPDLMILDEPTNHLDADTIEWLEGELKSYPGAVLMVTHDRYFLDHIVTRIVEFDHITQELISHPGSYQAYMDNKLERLQQRARSEEKRTNLLRTELEWLRRGPKARGTKAKARIQRAEALKEAGPASTEKSIQMTFKADRKLVGRILEVEGVAKAYDDKRLFEEVGFIMQRGDRVGLVGPNGSGKSTLIRLLMEQEEPDAGTITWGKNTRPGLLDQYRSGLDPEHTVLEAISPHSDMLQIGDRQVHKRTYLREFLFEGGEVMKKVESLSGGERCRLLLARMILEGSNFLILDEPTNDLDISSLQTLEQALLDFKGCVLLVTHDRYFLNKVCTSILAIEEGEITLYEGDYDFYRKRRDERERQARELELEEKRREQERVRTEARAEAPRKLSWKEKQELESIEEVILETEERRDAVEGQLADPALYRDHPERVAPLTSELADLNTQVEGLYARWEELEARA